jgi:hypothetical protein
MKQKAVLFLFQIRRSNFIPLFVSISRHHSISLLVTVSYGAGSAESRHADMCRVLVFQGSGTTDADPPRMRPLFFPLLRRMLL